MDKFGIFNLLNSFLGFANQKNESENGASPRGDSGFSGSTNFPNFSGTESSANNHPFKNGEAGTARKSGQSSDSAADKPEFLPLQQGMLSVMRSHDEFVKRVREKNARTERSEKNANKPE